MGRGGAAKLGAGGGSVSCRVSPLLPTVLPRHSVGRPLCEPAAQLLPCAGTAGFRDKF